MPEDRFEIAAEENQAAPQDWPYRRLAARLNELPQGFPPAADGAELRLLAKLFTWEEARLVAQLRLTLETPAEIAARLGGDSQALRQQLKHLVGRGLIAVGRASAGRLGYGLLPFVVGIYELQADHLDAELAQLFEDYYRQAYRPLLQQQPPAHRVLPINQSVRSDLAVHPFESAAEIIRAAKAWGVTDCVCRKQQSLLGQPCGHPLDVCLVFSETSQSFDQKSGVRPLSQAEALATLERAADAGLVHSVSNNQRGLWYLCNCCTCACGFLRGLAELGMVNVIARSAFVCQVDEDECIGCSNCVERCSFGALDVALTAQVNPTRCAGCGLCVTACPADALILIRRPAAEIMPPPETEEDWRRIRAATRGVNLEAVR